MFVWHKNSEEKQIPKVELNVTAVTAVLKLGVVSTDLFRSDVPLALSSSALTVEHRLKAVGPMSG